MKTLFTDCSDNRFVITNKASLESNIETIKKVAENDLRKVIYSLGTTHLDFQIKMMKDNTVQNLKALVAVFGPVELPDDFVEYLELVLGETLNDAYYLYFTCHYINGSKYLSLNDETKVPVWGFE